MKVSGCQLKGVYEARAMLKRERRLGYAKQHVNAFTKCMHADAPVAFVSSCVAVSMRRQVAGDQVRANNRGRSMLQNLAAAMAYE